ncbi:ATP-binding protein [Actinomadura decatromicini]|uniref:ATP-binding protein n=1 Tax=Actinomadura decatromicini TaxID=2604572 RepID=A0A5D3FFJ2_9ACTN|nr:ATP-binding protein [Actinomadura decatromicini]TYK46784.1 ATP-binding protein [Actinomadura decatromicini]
MERERNAGLRPYCEVTGDFPDAKGAVAMGAEDVVRMAGRVTEAARSGEAARAVEAVRVGEAGRAPRHARRRGGGAVGESRDPTVIGEVTLPGTRRAVGHARNFVRDLVLGKNTGGQDGDGQADIAQDASDQSEVDHGDVDETILDDIVMVVSETVANAITHTASGLDGGRVTVVLAAGDGRYRLEVGDDGAADGKPHVKDEIGAETGRGMRIVDALASRWGVRAEGPRTVVWAEFPAPSTKPSTPD